mmetsp:Transcript_6164/g.21055  ORF Transcript_6164/g.21055 Transcript_6164/m.21055 type:complete len:316 (-) Transcript_6164:3923-4870(-)
MYWVGRLVAFTAGAAFSGGFAPPKEGDSGWIHYLPREAKPSDGCPSAELGKVLCESCRNRCKYKMGDNAHAFVMLQAAAVWRAFQPTIALETRRAMEAWAEDNGKRIPSFGPNDVAVHDRCYYDTMLEHPQYGSMAFSHYDSIPNPEANRTIFVRYKIGDGRPPGACEAKREALAAHLRRRNPGAKVVIETADKFSDFAYLVYAPLVFTEPGSWGLWAMMANTGHVVAPRFLRITGGGKFFDEFPLEAHAPLSEHWATSPAPLLSLRVGATELNIPGGKLGTARAGHWTAHRGSNAQRYHDREVVEKIIRWLTSH